MFATVSLTVGLGLIALAVWMFTKSQQCKSWPSIQGVILESRIDADSLETMQPVLRYEYVVTGRKFVGHRVAFSGYGVSRTAMEALLAPYKVGQTVRVHYDPRNPARAVLDTRAPSDWLYWLIAGLMFCVLHAFLLSR